MLNVNEKDKYSFASYILLKYHMELNPAPLLDKTLSYSKCQDYVYVKGVYQSTLWNITESTIRDVKIKEMQIKYYHIVRH